MASEITIRQITETEHDQVDDLLALSSTRFVLHIPWESVHIALAKHPFFAVQRGRQLGCICGLRLEPDTVAQLQVVALRDAWPVAETLSSLWPSVIDALRQEAVRTLVFLGTESWLIDGLLGSGFHQKNTIVTLQKTTFDTPDLGHSAVDIRQAAETDFPAILEIDRAAFEPLWRHTQALVGQVLKDAAHFVIAHAHGQTLGYAYATMVGRHGHIARLSVHPDRQGQRIGACLMAEMIRFFERKRAFGITLNTQHDNVRSRRLYEWFGFKLLGNEAVLLVHEIQDR